VHFGQSRVDFQRTAVAAERVVVASEGFERAPQSQMRSRIIGGIA
jgi:hypothetical protein